MITHYDVLGVGADATGEEIRQAYHARARLLHPDRFATGSPADVDAARRAMQEVNEAFRILRDAGSRAAYDRSLAAVPGPVGDPDDVEDFDDLEERPYPRPPAEPGDVTVALVRAVPWVAALVILAIIFVFTAYARNGDGSRDLVGRCVVVEGRSLDAVPCDGPNHGLLVDVVDSRTSCPVGARAVEGAGGWYCLES